MYSKTQIMASDPKRVFRPELTGTLEHLIGTSIKNNHLKTFSTYMLQ